MDGFQNGKNTPDTPGVFVRAASKGLAGYGAWKSARKMGGGVKCAAMWKSFPTAPTPGFLYHPSVAVAELRRRCVSLTLLLPSPCRGSLETPTTQRACRSTRPRHAPCRI